jgi:hypothetical protein
MRRLAATILATTLFLPAFAQVQGHSVVLSSPKHERPLTGNFQVDFFGQTELATQLSPQSDVPAHEFSHKSPWLAAGLSAVLPGAGEFYAESYWKAAIFFAADVVAWTVAYFKDKKGDDQTTFYEGYANAHWSPGRYAKYAWETYAQNSPNYNGLLRENWQNLPPGQQVNWSILNRMERDISLTGEGRYYSHTLPAYGEQQYYELIGKYNQFNQGWDDADQTPGSFHDGSPVTARFLYYQGQRNLAEEFYTTARTFVTIALVNHVLSAIDAAWSASSYNKGFHARMETRLQPTASGYTLVPVARIEYAF